MNYIMLFFVMRYEDNGKSEQIMCKVLKKIHAKKPQEILSEYWENNQYPVDIVSIAKKIGIKLGSTDFTQLEKREPFRDLVQTKGHILGSVRAKDDDLYITYHNDLHDDERYRNLSEVDKKDKLLRRQRFTIAHEIAHCCLHMSPETNKVHIEYRTEQTDYSQNSKEREANVFAGELLIPLDILTFLCEMFGNNISIPLFASFFKVSRHVMEARMLYLQENGCLLNVIYSV